MTIEQRTRAVITTDQHAIRVTAWPDHDGWHYSFHIDGRLIDGGRIDTETEGDDQ